MSLRGWRYRAILLALVCLAPAAGGCVVILPALPENMPGYGCRYMLVDERGESVEGQGLLLMTSNYSAARDYVRCWKVEGGGVTVPKTSEVRFDGAMWGFFDIPMGFLGKFMNPQATCLYPLVPGYVPAGWSDQKDDANTTIDSRDVERYWLHLVAAGDARERRYLAWLMDKLDHRWLLGDDAAAREEARRYVWERLGAIKGQ